MKLLIGLGNPESDRKHTRHNIGFMLVNAYAERYNATVGMVRCDKPLGVRYLSQPNQTIILLRPQDTMNLSGHSVGRVCKALDIRPEDTLLIHDDLDLNFGTIRIKQGGGGSGGHRGVQSVINAIGPNFSRFKVGIGRPLEGTILEYVLSDFTIKERTCFCELFGLGVEVIDSFLTQSLQTTMARFNR
jgi:peptidyl-tRNA hydrolase, PTH1 family